MSSKRLQLLLSAAFAASIPPALAQDIARDTDLDCPAEVAAFLATVRADDAYSQVSEIFADAEARLDATMRMDGADCLIVLRDAQRVLVDADIVVAGASDPASVERVTRLAGGEPERVQRTVEVAPAAPATSAAPDTTIIEIEPIAPNAAAVAASPPAPAIAAVPDATIAAIDVPAVGQRPEPVPEIPANADGADGADGIDTAASTEATAQGLAVREVEFGFDSAEVSERARASVLADVAGMVGANAEATVLLTGHASPIGDAAYNLDLSKRRVAAVAEALRTLGVPAAAISTRAQGEENPEVRASEDAPSEENRRVEIRVVLDAVPERG